MFIICCCRDFIFTSIRSGDGSTLKEQANNSIKSLDALLRIEELSLDDIVKMTVTFKKGENFGEVKEVFRKHFKNGYPARNTIIVDEFLSEEILFQIEAIAYKPNKIVK
ncbi:MAG: hypothetical protein FH761_00655 [Firmicutes bacterium]|nr:hypothetical protein [Bacillota bacterium]